MRWHRGPLYPSRYRSQHDDSGLQDGGDEDDTGSDEQIHEEDAAEWSPHSDFEPLATSSRSAPRVYEQTYVYDPEEAQRELRAERRAKRWRNALCCALSAFTVVFVLVCLGVALNGSPTARAQTMTLLRSVERSSMVQFTITPKPHVVVGKYGRRWDETTDFYGLTLVRGQLFPYQSYTLGVKNRLAFNGWIHVETNTSAKYEIVLSDHRGYRVIRSVPLKSGRPRCLTPDDVPPLHNLRAAAEGAFRTQDYSSFRMNCSHGRQPPVEVVFAQLPFVFCPGDLINKTFSPFRLNSTRGDDAFDSQTLYIHGERLLLEANLVGSDDEARQARLERSKMEALEMWGNATTSMVTKCPYLEAPLSTYTPKSPRMLHALLGNISVPSVDKDALGSL